MISLARFFLRYKATRYLISGGTAAFVNLALIFILTEFAGIWYLASSMVSFIAGFIVSFTLQKFWTFKDARREIIMQQLAVYLAVALGTLSLNTLLLYLAVDILGLWYMFAQFLVSGILALGSYFIYNFFIFVNSVKRFSLRAAEAANEVSFSLPSGPGTAPRKFRAYIGAPLRSMRPLLILKQQLNLPDYTGKKPFRAVYGAMDWSFLELAREPADADFFLLPHSFFSARAIATDYVARFVSLSQSCDKKIVLFADGDSDEAIPIPNAIIFRTSQYAHKKASNEIMMPPQVYAGDVLNDSMFIPRAKREKPVVSFCGWAELGTFLQKAKFFSRNKYADFRTQVLRDPYAEVKKQGIYFRKKAMEALEMSPFVETSFIARDFFSVNKRTIKLPREILRTEYLGNITHSDFVLAPKGDGNFSIRFYEALALGRIPVLVDTECILPLQGEIDYPACVVRIPHEKISVIDKYVVDFYNRLDKDAWEETQKRARALFTDSLRLDVFLKNALTKLF